MSALRARVRPHERPVWSRERLIVERARLLANTLAPNTRIAYNAAFNSYMLFCNAHAFSMEPTPDTLSFYITYMASFVKPTTVASYLSGIASNLEEIYPEVRKVRKHWLVTRTLQGAMRTFNTPKQRKRHLTTEDLLVLDEHVDCNPTHDLLLFRAMVFVGFHGLLRADELTLSSNVVARDTRRTMMRSHLQPRDDGYDLTLRAHKADQTYIGSTVVLRPTDPLVNPIPRLNDYLTSRDRLFPLKPFLWSKTDGSVPSYPWFFRHIQDILGDDLGGSSMRSGGATWLAASGKTHDDIRSTGRWASDAYENYLRAHPLIVHAMMFRPLNFFSLL